MIECTGASKDGLRVRRYSYAIALEPALMELMRLYDRLGGADAAAAAELDAAIEHSLGERRPGPDGVHARMQLLLRARELHGFALAEPELTPLKLRLFEHLLQHRSAPERWAAIRELLLAHLPAICEAPLPGLAANAELYKRALSDRDGRLGRLLLTVAFFNMELEGEQPPPNLMLRFRRGAFPLHSWELCARDGRTAHLGSVEAWSPLSPHARWEYLALDLAHVLFRHAQDVRERRLHAPAGSDLSPRAPDEIPVSAIYCRFDADHAAQPPQLELFTLEPGALLAGLLRRAHAQHGPEGVKLLIVLLARLDDAPPGTPQELALPELAAAAGLGDASARGLRLRAQRLERLVTLLAGVELTRVHGQGDGAQARVSRLLTVLGRSGGWPTAAHAGERAVTLSVLVDPFLSAALRGVLAELPPLLLECAGKAHPFVLPLYVWLRRRWSGAAHPAPLECSARALLDDAGLWVSESGRYRALESLRRDLDTLREQGWLGAWRLQRSTLRDALEDRYRLTPPQVPAARAGVRMSAALAPPLAAMGTEARTGT